jgi:GDP-L-fucose synthase
MIAVERYDSDLHLNVGTGEDLTIRELAKIVSLQVGYSGNTLWDETKPDGTPRKVLDISRLQGLNWRPSISLEKGIEETIRWFESNNN